MIYAAETYSGAILEVLVHANVGRVPQTHATIAIDIPDSLLVERLSASDLLGWQDANQVMSRAFGDRWLAEARSAVLLVPAVVTRGREHNILLNPTHPDFAKITHSAPEAVAWDERLFLR